MSIISEGIYVRSIMINIIKNIIWIEVEWCFVMVFSWYLDLRELFVIDWDLLIGICIIWSLFFDFFLGYILRLLCLFLMLLLFLSCLLDNWSLLLNDMFLLFLFLLVLYFVMFVICFNWYIDLVVLCRFFLVEKFFLFLGLLYRFENVFEFWSLI